MGIPIAGLVAPAGELWREMLHGGAGAWPNPGQSSGISSSHHGLSRSQSRERSSLIQDKRKVPAGAKHSNISTAPRELRAPLGHPLPIPKSAGWHPCHPTGPPSTVTLLQPPLCPPPQAGGSRSVAALGFLGFPRVCYYKERKKRAQGISGDEKCFRNTGDHLAGHLHGAVCQADKGEQTY